MPVNLLGLMAIGMFYIITVVVGLCANRCLAHEDDEGLEEDEGGGNDLRAMEREAQLELVKLIETFHVASLARNSAPARTHHLVAATSSDASDGELQPDARSRSFPLPSARPRLVLHPAEAIHSLDEEDDADPDHIQILPDPTPQLNHVPRRPQPGLLQSPQSVEAASSRTTASVLSALPVGGKYLLAERNVGLVLGSLSLLAIRTGGVFSSSIVQMIYERGLLWCQVPIAASLSLIVGGAMFGGALYGEGYVTIMDVFQDVYGVRAGLVFFIPLLLGDVLFATIILSSLGALVETVLGFPGIVGVLMSVAAMLLYLLSGGLYAGTLTDASQFLYFTLGSVRLSTYPSSLCSTLLRLQWLLVPFALGNPYLKNQASLGSLMGSWLGEVQGRHSGIYIDQMALLILGGIPMQSYFQRLFSSTRPKAARVMTVAASLGCLANAVPAVLIGASVASIEWANTTLGTAPSPISQNGSLIMPIGLNLLVPSSVLFLVLEFLGLFLPTYVYKSVKMEKECVAGAIVSGLLAAGDSALFGLATVIAHNVYRNWLKPHASEKELVWLARLATTVLGLTCLLLCVVWQSWHSVWLIPYDILYVLVFPQLFCACYFRYANTVGALTGLITGLALRLALGEPRIGLGPLLPLLFWTAREGQLFPYRTLAMLANLLTTIIVSALVHCLWHAGKLAATPNELCCCLRSRRAATRRNRLVARHPEPLSPIRLLPNSAAPADPDTASLLHLRHLGPPASPPTASPIPASGSGPSLGGLPETRTLTRSQAAKLLANEFGRTARSSPPNSAIPAPFLPTQKMTSL